MSAITVKHVLLAISLAGLAVIVLLLAPRNRRDATVPQPSREQQDAGLAPVKRVRQLGTRHPIRVIKVGSDGRWVVACQARVDSDGDGRIHVGMGTDSWTGDELVPYLFRGGIGEGEALDELLDHSSDGRWLVVVRDSKLIVIDNVNGIEQLIPDADLDPGQGGYSNIARIDYEQKRLLYFHGTGRRTLVIRNLATQRELVAQASASINGIEPKRNSPKVALWLSRPPPRHGIIRQYEKFSISDARAHTCRTSGVGYSTPQQARPHDAWIDIETGEIKKSSAIIAYLNGQEVAQTADGAVRVGGTVIVPATCGANVRVASAHPLRLIAFCRRAKPGTPLEMFGPGMKATLTGTSASEDDYSVDADLVDDSPYICLQLEACFTLEDRRRIAIPGQPSEVRGPYIFSTDNRKQFVTDARSGVATPLLPSTRMRSRNDRVERIGELVVDFSLSPPRAVRELGWRDEAVDDHGRVLIQGLPPVSGSPLAWGPLYWSDPEL